MKDEYCTMIGIYKEIDNNLTQLDFIIEEVIRGTTDMSIFPNYGLKLHS
jgi:hypothetical protein